MMIIKLPTENRLNEHLHKVDIETSTMTLKIIEKIATWNSFT